MKLKSLSAALLALSLSAAPVAAAAPAPQPAPERIDDGSALYRTGALVPIVGVVVLALAIYLIIDAVGGGGDDTPVSP